MNNFGWVNVFFKEFDGKPSSVLATFVAVVGGDISCPCYDWIVVMPLSIDDANCCYIWHGDDRERCRARGEPRQWVMPLSVDDVNRCCVWSKERDGET